MQSTRIVAVRHGETDWNSSARIQGHRDIALNRKGLWQAHCTAQALAGGAEPVAAIYSSDLARAFDTALGIGRVNGIAVAADAGLRERSFGEFEGKTFAELEQAHPQDTARWRARDPQWAPPGGETLLALAARVRATTDALALRHLGAQIVLVAHGGVLDVLYRIATRQALDAPRTWQLGNASINRLLWTPQGLSMVGWSDTRHLDAQWHDEASS